MGNKPVQISVIFTLIAVAYCSDCSGLSVKFLDGDNEGDKFELRQPFELPSPSCGNAPLFIEEQPKGETKHLYYHHINKRWEIGMKRPVCKTKEITGDEPWLISSLKERKTNKLEGTTKWKLSYGKAKTQITLKMECTQYSLGGGDDFEERPIDEL